MPDPSADDRRGEKRQREPGEMDARAGTGEGTQELSISVDETNRLRATLGLKPLKAGSSNASEREASEKKRHVDERQRKEHEKETEQHRARVEAQREKRKLDEKLRRTRKLGEPDEDDNDMATWVAKSRVTEQERRREAEQRAAKEAAAKAKVARVHGSDDEEGDYTTEQLAGMKVKHGYGDLNEGETVILTLADRTLLNEKGELVEDEDEELENVLKAEEKRRHKARRAATKKGRPLFGEDGKKQSLLDKYDEEEEEVLRLDGFGGLDADERRQEEVRRRLAEGHFVLESVATTVAAPTLTSGSDFMSQSEAAAAFKPRRKKKDRQMRTKSTAAEDEGGGTADLMALLEAEAAAAGGDHTELGTRREGQGRREQKEREQAEALKEKRARYDNALEKANWASQALRASTSKGAAELLADMDDAGDELYESLSRARRQAQLSAQAEAKVDAKPLEEIAAAASARREADEAEWKAQLAAGAEVYNEATEFVRNIGAETMSDVGTSKAAGLRSDPTPVSGKKEEEGEGYMGMDVDEEGDKDKAEAGGKAEAPALPPAKWGAWVRADDGDQQDSESQAEAEKAKQRARAKTASAEDETITKERNVGRGLSSVLTLLHDKGELSDRNKVVWSGRTNDCKPVMLIGLDEVYQGGDHEERLARSIEVALTHHDNMGRVMTPKQRFREQCYRFHGIFPSKNQLEKKMRRESDAVKARQAATSENPSADLDRLRTIQQQTGKAHVVLSGKDALKPQSMKPVTGLGGGVTPVAGDRKVEMMLGIKKSGGSGKGDMPPPPPRKPT